MSLLKQLKNDVEKDQATAIQSIDDLSLVQAKEALVQSGDVDANEVDAVESEFKRFLAMKVVYAGTDQEAVFGPSESIDLLWHKFILETERYLDFCEQNLGFRVHHAPYTEARSYDATVELLSN